MHVTLKCQTCFYHNERIRKSVLEKIVERKAESLTLQNYFDIIDEASRCGIRYITLHGGEPTIHPYFSEILERAVEKGLKASFISNGYSTHKHIDLIKKANIRSLCISIDGTKETQDLIRGRIGLYSKQISLMNELSKNKIHFSISTYISELNFDTILEHYEYIDSLGYNCDINYGLTSFLEREDEERTKKKFDSIGMYSAKVECGSLQLPQKIINPDINVILSEISNIKTIHKEKKRKYKLSFPREEAIRTHFTNYSLIGKRCGDYYCRMVVDPYGQVIPCVMHGMLGCVVGDVRDGILEVWNSIKFREYRVHMNKGLVRGCKRCCSLTDFE